MTYAIYNKTQWKNTVNARFENYDGKTYTTKEKAINAMNKYKTKFAKQSRLAKKEGGKQYWEIRKVYDKKPQRQQPMGFGFGGF